MISQAFLLVPVLIVLSGSLGMADDLKLTGSRIPLPNAISQVDVIFTGQITKLGLLDPLGAEHLAYFGNKVHVVSVYFGTMSESETKVEIRWEASPMLNEARPHTGQLYVFLAKKNKEGDYDQCTAVKMLPATDDNIAKVKALIANVPAK